MASSVKHFCTICHDDQSFNSAVTWCTECEVFFCGDCEKPHIKSRLSKNHKTMSAEDYQKLPTFIQEISSQCRDHQKTFELYCSIHACPCCVKCVTNKHQKCQEMKPLSDILKQVKSSASVQIFENDLKNVKENLDKAIKYLKTRIDIINTQKTKAIEEISYMRKSIDDYLNKLEQTILDDLESKHSELKLNMASFVEQMEQRVSKVDKIQSEFTKITQYATDLQIYIGLREIEKTTSQAAKYIEELESGDHFSERNLEVNISSALQAILQDVKLFGDINVSTTSSTLQIKYRRKDQAQYLVPTVPEIQEIHVNPSLLITLTIPKHMKNFIIYACRILPDGKFILLDNKQKQLLLFNNDGIFVRKVLTLTDDPRDACFVRKNTVAVTLGSANQTALVDVQKNRIIQTIKLSHFCNGVASDDKTLVISSLGGQITKVNLTDMSHTILEGMEIMDHISLFQENIYGTYSSENKVCCYEITGEPLWTFKHHAISNPKGLTLDMNGFVYIVSRRKNSVVVVSPNGKACKTILSEDDGLKSVWAIDINRETEMMIVSSDVGEESSQTYYETAFVYKN